MDETKNVPSTEQPEAEAAVHAPLLTPEQIKSEVKPLSKNGFVAFWQKIWRAWLGAWYGFSDKHPKFSKILYMVFFFIVFSEGVTIWQYIVMTFLPFAFGNSGVQLVNGAVTGGGLWAVPFVWPAVPIGSLVDAAGNSLNYAIFNEPVKLLVNIQKDGVWSVETLLISSQADLITALGTYGTTYQAVEAGKLVGEALPALQCAGLGNFIAFEIAVFTAQCINFPLQRNITYRSKGNPYYQAMWYFIGWVLISIATNALWGILNPFMIWWNWNEAVIGLLKTLITGGLSMLVFFFIFLIIFPNVDSVAKKADAKLAKAKEHGASAEKIAKLELKATRAHETALEYNTRCGRAKAISLSNTRALSFERTETKLAQKQAVLDAAEGTPAEKTVADVELYKGLLPERQQLASDAIAAKYEAMQAYVDALDSIIAAKTARGEDTTKLLRSQSLLMKKSA